ncbi:MAG: hypothetical protein L0H64_22915, partial [Pseudonocardia sp.]|nr:hypothetical protein [Pseudonocardia sp.]
MDELGDRFGAADDPSSQSDAGLAEAVARADLRRSRQAFLGDGVAPDKARFARRVARAVAEPVAASVTPGSGLLAEGLFTERTQSDGRG